MGKLMNKENVKILTEGFDLIEVNFKTLLRFYLDEVQ
jgi:superfamily II DNA or RNA helicase